MEATINGAFRVLDGKLDVILSGANEHATYVAVPTGIVGLPIVGSAVAQTPTWTSSATVNYLRPITRTVDGFFNLTYNEQSGGVQDTVTSTAPLLGLSRIGNLSLRAGAKWQRLEAAIFVQNATDQTLQLLKFQQTGVVYAVRYNQPRTIGANAVYRW